MAYEPTSYSNQFAAGIQGQKFNAVTARDDSKKIKEQTKQQVKT